VILGYRFRRRRVSRVSVWRFGIWDLGSTWVGFWRELRVDLGLVRGDFCGNWGGEGKNIFCFFNVDFAVSV
jgi:hypothetical protein